MRKPWLTFLNLFRSKQEDLGARSEIWTRMEDFVQANLRIGRHKEPKNHNLAEASKADTEYRIFHPCLHQTWSQNKLSWSWSESKWKEGQSPLQPHPIPQNLQAGQLGNHPNSQPNLTHSLSWKPTGRSSVKPPQFSAKPNSFSQLKTYWQVICEATPILSLTQLILSALNLSLPHLAKPIPFHQTDQPWILFKFIRFLHLRK